MVDSRTPVIVGVGQIKQGWTGSGRADKAQMIAEAAKLPRLPDERVAQIEALHAQFRGRVKVSFGWGTLLTNDFRGLVDEDELSPFSLVCKAVAANGRPTVKLSDNPEKATGPDAEIARYRRVFDVGVQASMPVVV